MVSKDAIESDQAYHELYNDKASVVDVNRKMWESEGYRLEANHMLQTDLPSLKYRQNEITV
jgi:hypothetical protein